MTIADLFSILLMVFLLGGLVMVIWLLHRADGNEFQIADIFRDHTGRATKTAVGYFFGLFTGVWLVVAMELAGRTNELVVNGFFLYCLGGYAVHKLTPSRKVK